MALKPAMLESVWPGLTPVQTTEYGVMGTLAVMTGAVKPVSLAQAIPSRLPERNVPTALEALDIGLKLAATLEASAQRSSPKTTPRGFWPDMDLQRRRAALPERRTKRRPWLRGWGGRASSRP